MAATSSTRKATNAGSESTSTTKKTELGLTDLEKVTRVSTRENKLSKENRLQDTKKAKKEPIRRR